MAAPDVAAVLDAVSPALDERRDSGPDRPRHDGELHPPHRPVDGDREAQHEEIPRQVEERQEVHLLQEQPVQEDHRQVRQVLVVEELREAELEFGDPMVEGVLAVRQGLAAALDEQVVGGIVVQAGDREGHLRPERDRVEDGRDQDEQQQDRLRPPALGIDGFPRRLRRDGKRRAERG